MLDNQDERVRLTIIHDYAEDPESGECWPGEEIAGTKIFYRGRWYWIPWSPTHMIVVDLLCRNRYRLIGLDAWQITAKLQSDPFVLQHATNAPGHQVRPARTSRTAVRQQIKRVRSVLTKLIEEEGLDLKADDIIRSEETSTRVVRYRIACDVSWEHWPRQDDEHWNADVDIPLVYPLRRLASGFADCRTRRSPSTRITGGRRAK